MNIHDYKFVRGTISNQNLGHGIYVTAFGRYFEGEEQDWTLRHMNGHSLQSDSSAAKYLPAIAEQLGIHEILSPSPGQFNGLVCTKNELTAVIPLGGKVRLFRGFEADGCVLGRLQSYAVSTGGCAVVIARRVDPESGKPFVVIAAHAGVMSAMNNLHHHVIRALGCTGKEKSLEGVHIDIFGAIAPESLTYPWDDPKFGALQQALCEYIAREWGTALLPGWENPETRKLGRVDLPRLLCEQFKSYGVPEEQIRWDKDPIETWVNDKKTRWYTTRCLPQELRARRNLILVTRY